MIERRWSIRAWFRIMRDAEGQVGTKKLELTTKLYDANIKASTAKELPAAISQWEGDIREFEGLSGKKRE